MRGEESRPTTIVTIWITFLSGAGVLVVMATHGREFSAALVIGVAAGVSWLLVSLRLAFDCSSTRPDSSATNADGRHGTD